MGFEIVNGVLKKYTEEQDVTEVVIPDGVTSIGERAFEWGNNLTDVTIPDSVTSIGNKAFEGCYNLTNVTIPDSVTSIRENAFSYTPFYNNDKREFVIYGRVLYKYKGNQSSVTIPDCVTSIGNSAFRDCSNLTTVTIPNSVTNIGDSAFLGCKGLADDKGFVIIRNVLYSYYGNDSEVTIPDSVTNIGNSAFRDCSNLTTVTIPDSVTSVGKEAFYKCSSLNSVTIPDSVTSIGSDAFYDTPFYSNDKREFIIYGKFLYKYKGNQLNVTIPDSVTSIGKKAFECCSLSSITIPDSVTSIGDSAFSGCISLTNVTIPDSVTGIGDSAFSWCSSLTTVTIPDSVKKIGDYAFELCTDLTTVNISEKVVDIVGNAFWGDSNLKKCPAFGYLIDGTKCQWGIHGEIEDEGSENDNFIKKMLIEKNYDEDSFEHWDDTLDEIIDDDIMNPIDFSTKCQFVAQVFLKDHQPEAEAYIKENISEILPYFIDIDDYATVKGLLEHGKFVTKRNIMKFIDYAIEHTQNGGDMQIQVLLMNYKNDNFPDMDPLKSIKF